MGLPRNLGDLDVPKETSRDGRGTAEPSGGGASSDPAEQVDASEVPPSEGNEARRDGRREVGASRSTDEGGEPNRRDPSEGGARRGAELL